MGIWSRQADEAAVRMRTACHRAQTQTTTTTTTTKLQFPCQWCLPRDPKTYRFKGSTL